MRGDALIGHAPRSLKWSADGAELQFTWAKADGTQNPESKEYIVKKDGTGLAPAGARPFAEKSYAFPPSPPASKSVYVSEGDIYLKDPAASAPLRLTHSTDTKEDPQLVLDNRAVIYLHDGNLFKISVPDGNSTQITDIKPSDEAPVTGDASEAALSKEESELFKTYPPSGRTPSATNGRRGGSGARTRSYSLSPNRNHATFSIVQPAAPGKTADVPNYVTRSGYPEMIPGYEKVGEPQSRSKILVIDLNTGQKIEIAGPRPGRTSPLRWSPDGKHAVTWADSEDFKDAWLLGFDPATDKVSILWSEHDDAWVGGPGRNLLGWLPDSSRVYFESEATGFANLYTLDPVTGISKDLTQGPFEVSRVTVDTERNRFTFVSSEGSPFKRHIDTVDFDGGLRKKLADYSADEDATFAIAPNGVDVAVVRSRPNHPSELFVNGVQVTETPTAEWLSHDWIDPAVVMIPAQDGVPVPGRLYKPKHWHRGGPAVIFVHGAGYLQNVFQGWSHYFREYMFHNLLTERGYAVLDLDYRGSAGYGKVWRTAIYRRMGGKDLTDQVDGANWLIKNLGVNKQRIGIYGGSYGGFITLMAMFTTPDVFAAGAALRPVSDWANYNHRYTGEILNLPQNDPDAYRFSSPIYHAEGLKGELLICHGMVDTNVNFRDTVRLVERLVELGKTGWEVAPYPVEDHGFTLPASWTDEYRRILALFDRAIGAGFRRK
jgi:dipeptidyl aminopeptidase/acylaminoacyl peptidase